MRQHFPVVITETCLLINRTSQLLHHFKSNEKNAPPAGA